MTAAALDPLVTFLALVEADREARAGASEHRASQEEAEILGQARRDARRRVSAAVRDERERTARQLDAARAQAATRERLLVHDVRQQLLGRGLERLESELRRRWEDPGSRAAWIRAAIAEAARVLPRGAWRIEHAPALEPNTLDAIGALATTLVGEPPVLAADAGIDAGIRIEHDGARLDTTLEGLLADRDVVAGRLLKELGT